MPARLIGLAHSVSSAMSMLNLAGEPCGPRAAQIVNPRLDLGIGEASIGLLG